MLNIQKRMAFLISLLFSFLFFQSSVLLLAATNHSYYINDLSAIGDKFCTAAGLSGNDGLSPSTPNSSITNLIKTYINFPANSTVYVDSGTYNEAVLISSTLHGSNSGNITFQGAEISNQISTIAGDGVNASCVSIAGSSYIRITGFRITHPLSQGILVSANSSRIQIDHNTINSNSSYGIKLDSSYHCSLFSNTCNKNTSSGIYFTFASTNQVNMNTLNNNLMGIYMDNSYNCTLTGNNINNNQDGIFFNWFGQNNLFQSNIIWKNSRYGIVNGGSYNKNNFFYNTIYSNSSTGLQMSGTSNQFVGNIVYRNTADGISSVSKSLVSRNICRYNGGVGIGVLGMAVIQGNLCSFNSFGIRLANGFNRAVSNNCSSNSQSGICGDNPCGTNTISYNICSTNTLYGISLNQNNIGSIITHNLISRNKSKGVLLGFLNGSGKSFISNIVWKNYGDGFDNGSGHKKDIFAYNIVCSNSGRGIAMTTVSNQFIGNSVFQNTSDGIRGGAGSVISGNICRYNAASGIYINGNSTVQGNLCSHNQYGFYMQTIGGTIFSNNFSTNTTYGLNGDNCRFVNIVHNIIGTNNNAGLYLGDQCRTNFIRGNNIFKNVNGGIGLNWNSSYGTFQSNYISRNKNKGIDKWGNWTKNIFSYNVVCSNTGIGIDIQSLSNQFIGNSVFRNGGDGIKTSSGAVLIGNTCRSNISGSGISALGNSTLKGNLCSYNWYGITLQSSINSAYSNNASTNLQSGIFCAAGCTTNTIAYNDINKNGIYGIWLNANNYGSVFAGNKITRNNNHGICFDWTGGYGKSFISNIIWKNGGDGFNAGTGHKKDFFAYNTVYSNTGSGINRSTTTSNWFIGNTIYGNTVDGITAGPNAILQDNICKFNGGRGVYLNTAASSIVYKNLIYKNSSIGISAANSSSASIVNNTIFSNNGTSISVDGTSSAVVKNVVSSGNNGGLATTGGALNVSYSCTNDGTSGAAVTHGLGNITCKTLFTSTLRGSEDFRLLWNSRSQSNGEPSTPVVSQGTFVQYDAPTVKYSSKTNRHFIRFKTSFNNGSIPANGTIVVTFSGPGSFNLTGAQISTTSAWGGSPGTFTPVVFGQSITVARSGGNNSVAGAVEELIISGITNPPVTGSNYKVTVQTKDGVGNSIEILDGNYFNMITLYPPVAPSIYSATSISTNQINVTWNRINNAASYSLFRNIVNSTTGVGAFTGTTGVVTNFSDIGLQTNTQYFYWVKAINNNGSSAFSASATATTKAYQPAIPGWISATGIATNQIQIAWNAAAHASGYKLYKNTVNNSNGATLFGTIGTGAGIYTNAGLSQNKTNFYWIKATNSGGVSGFSSMIDTMTLPAAPAITSTVVLSTNAIALSWTSLSPVSTYTLYSSLSSATNTGLTPVPLSGHQLSFTNNTLQSNTVYYFHVKAVNSFGGISSFSTVTFGTTKCVIPAAPSWVSAQPRSPSDISLIWNTVGKAQGYKLYHNSNMTTNGAILIKTFVVGAVSFTNTGLTQNTTNFYWLKSTNSGGSSGFSSMIDMMTLPAAPAIASTVVLSSNAIALSWTSLSPVSTYTLYSSLSSATNTGLTPVLLSGNQLSFTNNTLQSNTVYYFHVKAVNSFGGASAFSAVTSGTTKRVVPLAPVFNFSFVSGWTQVQLAWNDTARETGFILYRSLTNSAGTGSVLVVLPQSVTFYTDRTVQANTTYYYFLKAQNSGGNSIFSSSTNAVVPLPSVPAIPSGLMAKTVAKDRIRISWQDISFETSYTLYMSKSQNSNSAAAIQGLPQNTTNTTVAGLTSATAYYFWIKAFNLSGSSGFSLVTTAITLKNPGPETPGLTVWNNAPTKGESILIYVNPLENHVSDTVDIKIYSFDGILVKSINGAPLSQQPVKLETSGMAPGVYILHVKGSGVNNFKRIYIK